LWSISPISSLGSHWPDCNWCSRGTTHLVNPGNGGNNDTDGDDGSNGNPESGPPDPNNVPDDSDPYPDGGDMDESGSDKEDAKAIEETLDEMSGDDSAAPVPTAEHVTENDSVARRLSSIVMESRLRRVRRVAFDFELGNNVDLHSNHSKGAWVGSSTIYSTETSTGPFADVSEMNSQSGTSAGFSSMATDSASLMDNQWATATSQPSESAAGLPQVPSTDHFLYPPTLLELCPLKRMARRPLTTLLLVRPLLRKHL